jgi:2-polyprenyl-3-methyl-5-hydroxy-6-metoxy-1,4-benzoquinol methylase
VGRLVYNFAMSILLDLELNETTTLFGLFNDFAGKSVLEIGCGDGRLTWRYAARAARVTAIDPDTGKYAKAIATRPSKMSHVQLMNSGLEPFAAQNKEKFDIAILAWSL